MMSNGSGTFNEEVLDDAFDEKVLDDVIILTEEEMLFQGLQLLGWTEEALAKYKKQSNVTQFRGHYGADPHVLAEIWKDLQTTKIAKARLDPSKRDIKHFFLTFHFLKQYPTELERETTWKVHENKLHEETWYYVELIRKLKASKLGWPSDDFGDLIWVLSVDGVHFWTEEPNHPELPKDLSYFSYKNHCAGFNYEVGIALHESKCVWFNGPYPSGKYNDIKILAEKGLKQKLKGKKKKCITDHGYQSYPKVVSTMNSHNTGPVHRFKIRARQRHEKWNGKVKECECLSSTFCHSKEQLQACFEAVAVIVQYTSGSQF
jgi:hypothetical protein